MSALAGFSFLAIQPYGTPDPLGLGVSSWTALCYAFAVPVLLMQFARHVRIPLTRFDYFVSVYVVIVLATWPTGVDRQASLNAIAALLGQLGVFYAVRLVLAESPRAGDLIVTVFVVGIAAVQLMAIGSHLERGLFNRLTEYPSPHAWGGRPEIGFLAAIQFSLLLGIRWRVRPRTFRLALFCLVLSSAVEVIFLYSRLAWIAALGALVVWGLVSLGTLGWRWRALALACVALPAAFLIVRDPTLTRTAESVVGAGRVEASPAMRWVLLRRAERMIRDRPLVGVGLGNFQAAYVAYYDPHNPDDDSRLGIHAHNLFLHQTGEVGLFGGIAYAAMWGFGLIAGWKEETVRPSERNPPAGGFYALIVIVVMGFGENMFLDSVFWPRARLHSVAWILLGLIVAAWSRRVRRA